MFDALVKAPRAEPDPVLLQPVVKVLLFVYASGVLRELGEDEHAVGSCHEFDVQLLEDVCEETARSGEPGSIEGEECG